MRPSGSEIAAAYRSAFKDVFKHWKTLLPGSLAFYLPEFLAMLGYDWLLKPLIANMVKAAVMILLIALALRVTGDPHEQKGSSDASYSIQFFIGDMAFWALLLLLAAPAFYYASINIEGMGEGIPSLLALIQLGQWKTYVLSALMALPAGYAFLRLNFFGFLLRQRGGHFIQAWGWSWNITREIQVSLAVFYIWMALLLLLGLAAWTVGILYTFPVSLLATARIYRKVISL